MSEDILHVPKFLYLPWQNFSKFLQMPGVNNNLATPFQVPQDIMSKQFKLFPISWPSHAKFLWKYGQICSSPLNNLTRPF
jgi:hypothetical protein